MARTGRPRADVKRSEPIKAQVYPHEKNAFAAACRKAKVSEPDALRALAEAWVEYASETARPTLHIKITHTENETD